MLEAPIPSNEKERLAALKDLKILDTAPEERFDRITQIAQRLFNVPICALSLIDSHREWFKSRQGFDDSEGPRAISFCGHTILEENVFVIPDALADQRFFDNPTVAGKPHIRFYAGQSICSANGHRVGTFCIKDTKPCEFSGTDKALLRDLAIWAELEMNMHDLSLAIIERKKAEKALIDHQNRLEELVEQRTRELQKLNQELQQGIEERKRAHQDLRDVHGQLIFEKRKLEQLLSIDHKMRSLLDLNHLVDFIVHKATAILEAEKCSLMLLDPETHELLIRGAVGLDNDIIKQTRIKFGDQIAGLVAKEDQPLLVTDIENDFHVARANRSHYRSKSFISVPINIHNRLEGVVNVADKNSKEGDVFTEIDLKILNAIVRQAAIAIENANYYRKLEHLSTTDSLTTLFNHRYFLLMLDREIDRLKRYPKPLCLLMLDIDDFKVYNDTYGHLEGDSLLKDLSALLKNNLRKVDIICRYAGDEFVAILPETGVHEAEIIAHKLKNALIQQRFRKKVTISIGIAKCGTDMSRRDLIMKADQALYQSKHGGRNRICCFY